MNYLHTFSKCNAPARKLAFFVPVALLCFFITTYGQDEEVTINEAPPSSYPKEIVDDWKAQDGTNYETSIKNIKDKLTEDGYDEYAAKVNGSGEQGYLEACHWRRVTRMQPRAYWLKKIMYARHHNLGSMFIGFTEELKSDGVSGLGPWGNPASSKSTAYPKGTTNTAILLLEYDDFYPEPEEIITDNTGVLRDPCPSYDGKTLVYAHSKDNDGYHIWDMNLETGEKRQLTDNLGDISVSDMEPCVTPYGDIIFESSRCFQPVDCNTQLVSNLYIMNKNGKYMRRIAYDQVNTFYPTMMSDGSVMYTRWEYQDRNVSTVFGIFMMNPDGTRQTEFYGNQTENPATFNQARQIPGTMKCLATLGGHQGPYAGDLAIVDASIVRNGKEGVELIAPRRTLGSTSGMDGVPDKNKLFQNPYPLDEKWFLISYRRSRSGKFNIYLMNPAGDRELIASDDKMSVSQPISLAKREIPPVTAFQADYTDDKAYCAVVDVGYGMAVQGVKREDVEKIRVIGMQYRVYPAFGNTGSFGYQMTPVGRYGCSWEAKWIVGECPVESDGSAAFEVPPRTPLFLQLIDKNGVCIQTMRSWMTLQPGERFECMGCHEDKNAAPLTQTPKAVNAVPLTKFQNTDGQYGSYSWVDFVQPVLDKNCVKSGCHDAGHSKLNLSGDKIVWSNNLSDNTNNNAYRNWHQSYLNLSQDKYVHCNAILGSAAPVGPRKLGSPKSAVIDRLLGGHKDVPKEAIEVIAAWIDLSIPHSGNYYDDMKEEHQQKYLARLELRKAQEEFETENIQAFIDAGQWTNSDAIQKDRHETGQHIQATVNSLNARFLSNDNIFTFTLPSEGEINLFDLKGRQIFSRVFSREMFLGSAGRKMKLLIPAGTYIVKFTGVNATLEQVLSVL